MTERYTYSFAIDPSKNGSNGIYGFFNEKERAEWLAEHDLAYAVERHQIDPDIRAEYDGKMRLVLVATNYGNARDMEKLIQAMNTEAPEAFLGHTEQHLGEDEVKHIVLFDGRHIRETRVHSWACNLGYICHIAFEGEEWVQELRRNKTKVEA